MISVFIPTYNASSCIDETLKSVLSQTYNEIEVWVVDDCSTDQTPEILDAWARSDSRVKVLHKEKNEGFVPFSWNRVFPLLKGEFTLYLSHDDLVSEDCIEKLVAKQQETGADCVIPEVRMWNASQDEKEILDGSWTIHDNSCLAKGMTAVNGKTAFAHMLNYDIPGFALWRSSIIEKVGKKYSTLHTPHSTLCIMPTEAWNSDEGMQRIWAFKSQKVTFATDAKFYYRITPRSITKGLKPYHLTGLKTQERLIKAAFTLGIWWRYPKQTLRFVWQYCKSYRYLKTHITKK